MDYLEIDDLIIEKAETYGLDVEAVTVEDINGDEYIQYRFRGPLSYFSDLVNDEDVFNSGYVVDGETGSLRYDAEMEEHRQRLQREIWDHEEDWDDWDYEERDW